MLRTFLLVIHFKTSCACTPHGLSNVSRDNLNATIFPLFKLIRAPLLIKSITISIGQKFNLFIPSKPCVYLIHMNRILISIMLILNPGCQLIKMITVTSTVHFILIPKNNKMKFGLYWNLM